MSGEPKRYCPICRTRKYELTFRGTHCDECWRATRIGRERKYFGTPKEIDYARHRAHYQNQRVNKMVNNARSRSKRKGFAYDLDDYRQEIKARLDRGLCELSGLPFGMDNAIGFSWDSPSIDRVKPELGYIYSNIRLVLYGLNAAMGNWGEDVLRAMTEYLHRD